MLSTPTYCRICTAQCGLVIDTDGDHIVAVRPDRENPLSRGYSCKKGRAYAQIHQGPTRLLSSLARGADGAFVPVDTLGVVPEIAVRLRAVLDAHGPQSVGVFRATQSYLAALARPASTAWLRKVGSAKLFSASTIDQSAKSIAGMRMGRFAGGLHALDGSDVMLLAGINPLVSHIGGQEGGFPICDPLVRLREARERGLKLIVIDPRRTETARHADLFLQPRPGEDALLYAGLIRQILREELHDAAFCEHYVDGLEALRAGVEVATPEFVAARTGLRADEVIAAARLFGSAARGSAITGTGPDMAPRSNVAEHLIACLNAICGRYLRAGEHHPQPGVFQPRRRMAMVSPPHREWESSFRSRIGGHGTINGELPSAILADEMLEPGPDRIRALVVIGGNPASCLPDQRRAVEALRSLELLVTIDPFMSETAALADYVIAPVMALERPDHTMGLEAILPGPFAQCTDAVIGRPPGLLEEWEFFWELSAAMGMPISTLEIVRSAGDARHGGAVAIDESRVPDPYARPTSHALLELLASGSRIPYAHIASTPHGAFFPDAAWSEVLGPPPDAQSHRMQLLPDDVTHELRTAVTVPSDEGRRSHLLVGRRSSGALNTTGRSVCDPRERSNPAYVHPDDLVALGLRAGSVVRLESDHGSVDAMIAADASVRRGVVSMTHCWGWLPGEDPDPADGGANPSRLISTTSDVESINRMPRMSAIPVDIRPLGSTGDTPS